MDLNDIKTTDFDYDLPEELIAQTPLKDRKTSRMMVLHIPTGEYEHKHFYDIVDYLAQKKKQVHMLNCYSLNKWKMISGSVL